MEEWVKAAQAGEQTAWNVLYQKYYPALYAIAIQVCKNFSDAKDIVQDSFLTAYVKLSQLKESATFGAWLKKIHIRNCYQWLHQKKKRGGIDFITLPDDHVLEHELENKLDDLSSQNRLYTAVSSLPEILKTALLLRYFSNFQSYSQIASILAIPVGTVRSRLNEAKSKLVDKWQQPAWPEKNAIHENDHWNSFYYEIYSGMHYHDNDKNKLLEHLNKSVQIVLPDGRSDTGSRVFENIIADDRRVGSYLTPVNIITSGNISIIEVKHYNSPEHPHHCPPRSVTMLFRKNDEVNKLKLYFSAD